MNKTKYVILGLLMEQPLSGYSIKQIIDVRFKFFWSESYGQIYPQLKRLLDDELIKEIIIEDPSRGKKMYGITEKGITELKNWLAIKPEKESIRMEMLLKYYFGNYARTDDLLMYIIDFGEEHRQDLNLMYQFKAELEKISHEENHEFILQILDLGIKTNIAYVKWSEETVKKLMEKKDV